MTVRDARLLYPRQLYPLLNERFDVKHIKHDLNLAGLPDPEVYALAVKQGRIIHRGNRCDLSLFQLGLRLLDHLLNEDRAIPVAFYVSIET